MGGRANNWRRLNLEGNQFSLSSNIDHIDLLKPEDIPRHSIFYDIVSYIQSGNLSPELRERIPTLLAAPTSPNQQLEHIQLLRQIKFEISLVVCISHVILNKLIIFL